jgi:hypothetical protein
MNEKLEKLISWLNKLNNVEFEITVNTLLKPEERNTISNLDRASFLGYMQVLEKLSIVEQLLLDKYPERFAEKTNPSTRIRFTNQENIIDPIIYEHGRSYHILDAPAGYGKTALLQELNRKLETEFLCAYVSTIHHKTILGLIKALFSEFKLPVPAITEDSLIQPTVLPGLVATLGGLLKIERKKQVL